MKKTYITPTSLIVQLSGRNPLMSLSAVSTLSGTEFGGESDANGIIEADIKSFSFDNNLWDDEW